MAGKKQAVVVIHGMGEQQPMHTIRDFVNAVWKQDPNLDTPRFWSKPSSIHKSFEQRRLTTNPATLQKSPKQSPKENQTSGSRTDFYEYYWADKTVGTNWQHFVGWFVSLLFKSPSTYYKHPNKITGLWITLWLLVIGIGLFSYTRDSLQGAIFSAAVLAFIMFVASQLKQFAIAYFGDVARYVRAKPENIKIRQSIREGGIELLEKLHATGDYDRIVLVGHSLGSIVAYDILNHFWSRRNKFKQNGTSNPLTAKAVELADKLAELSSLTGKQTFDQEAYRDIQAQLFDELTSQVPDHWLISDFVTLGSPLTYADFLLFDKQENFALRKRDREYPLSPPIMEHNAFYYGAAGNQFLHHGAVFAPVKWTNIYCPHEHLIFGDIISGPVSRNFSHLPDGNGDSIQQPADFERTPIREISLKWRDLKSGFCHTEYWSYKRPSVDDTNEEIKRKNRHLRELREALALYKKDKGSQ